VIFITYTIYNKLFIYGMLHVYGICFSIVGFAMPKNLQLKYWVTVINLILFIIILIFFLIIIMFWNDAASIINK